MSGPKAEFDRYAGDHDKLIRDPMRDRFAQGNDFFHRRKWILIADFLKRHTLDPAALAWLDVGCGKGELLGYGRAHFGRSAGCDFSREMIREAGGVEVHWQEKPDALPFPDASFDFVTSVCVYHHVEEANRLPLTREMHRVLRPSGILCTIEHNPLNPVTRLIVSRTPVDADARLLTLPLARGYAAQAGLWPVESQYFLYLPEWLYDRIGGLEKTWRKVPLGGQYAMFARK